MAHASTGKRTVCTSFSGQLTVKRKEHRLTANLKKEHIPNAYRSARPVAVSGSGRAMVRDKFVYDCLEHGHTFLTRYKPHLDHFC